MLNKLFAKTEEVYLPREDSFLLQNCIPRDLKGKSVLDVGTGSGILAITAAKNGAKVVAIDVNVYALKLAEENASNNSVKIKFVKSDLFSHVKGKFDLVINNPPYLPEDDTDKIIGPSKMYSGGPNGRVFIEKFVKSVGKFLKPKGKILMLISSLTGEQEVLDLFHSEGFKTKIIAKEKIPWEELIVISASH